MARTQGVPAERPLLLRYGIAVGMVVLALLLTLWFVPGVLIYTAYYWGLNRGGGGGVGYLRFFLTLFPPAIIAACWVMRRASDARWPEMQATTP